VSTAYYDQVFLVPVARRARGVSRSNFDAIVEWEFSDEMRSQRFLPGWYLLPTLGFAVLAIALLGWL
jgi:hypothetical protein